MERLDKFKEYLILGKYSQNTTYSYLGYARKFEANLGTKPITQDYVNSQIALHNHRVYRAFLKHYLLVSKIKIDIPKIKGKELQKKLKYIPWKEIEVLVERLPTRESLLVKLCSETGLRISEAVNLKLLSVDRDNLTISGVGKMNKEFELPISKKTLAIIDKYTAGNNYGDYILNYGHVKHRRQKAWYNLKKNAFDIIVKDIYPHMLRHSCGTRMLKLGFNLREIQVFLRHSKIETTKIYTSIDKEKLYTKVRNLNDGDD